MSERRISNAASTLTEVQDAVSLARQETGGFGGLKDRVGLEDGVDVKKMPTGELVYPGLGTKESPYIVSFPPNDPRGENPLEWSSARKYTITMITAIATLCIAYCSSAYAGAIAAMIGYFKVSQEVLTLGVSLYVLGFALGPLVWAPLSELFGRRYLFLFTYAPFTFFHIGCALATNIETLLICRFFAGMFGSSPLTNSGGVISDMFIPRDRSLALSFFAAAPFSGPVLGPIVAGFVGETVGWRANFWIMFGFSAVMLIANVFLVPETYAPAILRRRAAKEMEKANGKRVTKDEKDVERGDLVYYVSIYDAGKPRETLAHKLRHSLTRPFKMLMDPIVLLFALYAALVYGTLYLTFTAFPIIFVLERGWSEGIGGLGFLGLLGGTFLGICVNLYLNKAYVKKCDAAKDGIVPPEARLPGLMIGGVVLPVGLYIFTFTLAPSIHWIVPILATIPFGCGITLIFLCMMNYLVDFAPLFAASSLAANAVLRSLFGAAFPLFGRYMYENLTTKWATFLVACLALLFAPIPFFFYKYGARIRAASKFNKQQNATKEDKEDEREEDVFVEEEHTEFKRQATIHEEQQRAHGHSEKEMSRRESDGTLADERVNDKEKMENEKK